jgi:hypothetical protein
VEDTQEEREGDDNEEVLTCNCCRRRCF